MKIRFVFSFLLFMATGLSDATAMLRPAVTVSIPAKIAKGKFIHVVCIWLKSDLDRRDIKDFEKGMRELKKIKSVRSMEIGRPAGTKRDVVDNTYSYMMVFYFKDATGHALYQIDPIHQDFVDKHKAKWMRIQVYDALIE